MPCQIGADSRDSDPGFLDDFVCRLWTTYYSTRVYATMLRHFCMRAPLGYRRVCQAQVNVLIASVKDINTLSRRHSIPQTRFCSSVIACASTCSIHDICKGDVFTRCFSSRSRSSKSSSGSSSGKSSQSKQRNYNYPKDPYQVLNVPRTASEKEIKMAYFKEAKKCHPDLNPGDPVANEKFQALSDAYQLLIDSSRRAQYDTYGSGYSNKASDGNANSKEGYQQTNYYYESPEEMFRKVSEDVNILREAFKDYIKDMQDEFIYAADCAEKGEWSEVFEIMKQNKEVVIAMILPIILLRFPFLIALFLRLGLAGSQVIFVGLVRSGNLEAASRMVWKKVLQLAIDRRNRRKR